MKITFLLTALGLHQLAFSNELYKRLGNDFHFISTERITHGRFGVNYEDIEDSVPYVIKAYSSEENEERAKRVLLDSDVIILGSCTDDYLRIAYQNTRALLFIYSERIFKTGYYKLFIPKSRKSIKKRFLFNHPNVVVLSASAFLSKDLSFFNASIPVLKWGYFPRVEAWDIDNKVKHNKTIKLLWSGRMVGWKRPLDAIKIASSLKAADVDFELSIVGNGKLYNTIENRIKKLNLQDRVILHKAMTTDELFEKMKESDIYLFTSNFQEGWGAILNEAMNAGCVCICSHAAGCVPYLIDDGNNGLIYECGNIQDLYRQVRKVIDNSELLVKLGSHAYKTITDQWNHTIAAERLILLSDEFSKSRTLHSFSSGILSKAEIIDNNWYKCSV